VHHHRGFDLFGVGVPNAERFLWKYVAKRSAELVLIKTGRETDLELVLIKTGRETDLECTSSLE
jgi:hypothetical protein